MSDSDQPAAGERLAAEPLEFERAAGRVRDYFNGAVERFGHRLFTTNAGNLFAAYLDAFPADRRQYHRCGACRRFVETYGGLVFINDSGETVPAVWPGDGVPPSYRQPIAALHGAVRRARVTGVFVTQAAAWGTPVAGARPHFSVIPPEALVHSGLFRTAVQIAAEKKEDHRLLLTALSEFPAKTVDAAVDLLNHEALYRGEKIAGPAQWLQELHRARHRANAAVRRDNLTWRAVATAPVGFCHVRSTMIGTLLVDLTAGLPFADVKKRFDAKMHPLLYQRPQAAPTAGNLQRAEQIVAQLGLEPALRRRFARLDEVKTLWRARAGKSEPTSGGVFGHLLAKVRPAAAAAALQVPVATITWEKFARTILPKAERIEVLLEDRSDLSLCALVTAVEPTAPPVLQWDSLDARNPVSWYVYASGSSPARWGLTPGWHEVAAVVPQPSLWHETPSHRFEHHGRSVILVLPGAQDRDVNQLCLFPEHLRPELHEVRATLEAFSRSRKIEGADQGSANGLRLDAGRTLNCRVRVATASGGADYLIDRWD